MFNMEHHNKYSGRMYLAKGNEQIYVDVHQLVQHQIEGIRFLYRQFKKEHSGIILNDPASSGKTHQVVLFLKAIKHLLDKPILILCGGHEKNHWLTHFYELTDFGDGVLVEPSNLNTRRLSVCIDTKINLGSLVKHNWSIVVVDDDSAVNEVLKRVFNTKYKIWISSVDMKTNLEAFWSIFGWLYPKDKDTAQKIIADAKSGTDILILLDAVMEDVVLRRMPCDTTMSFSPIKTRNKVAYYAEKNINIKKKDVSGSKIKRSKTSTTTSEKSAMSSVPITIKNMEENSENVNNSIGNAKNSGNHPEEPITTVEDIVLQETEGINEYVTDELNDQEIVNVINETKHVDSGSKISNDFLNDTLDVHMENDETPEIISEPNTPITVDTKVVDDLNLLNSDEVKVETSKFHMLGAREQLTINDNKEIKNKSCVKTIDDVMRETEEKALQKFKGSLLDSIFGDK